MPGTAGRPMHQEMSMSSSPRTITVAFTGASGLPYGVRLVECLLQAGHQHLAPAAAGALRVMMFAQLQKLDSAQTDSWLAQREADELGGELLNSVSSLPAAAGVVQRVGPLVSPGVAAKNPV